MTTIACPGEVVGSLSTHSPGPGTHVYESKIYASVTGPIDIAPAQSKEVRPVVSISNSNHAPQYSQSTEVPSRKLPHVGSTIIGRVLRVQQRQLGVAILLTDPTGASTSNVTLYTSVTNDDLQPQAVLRREDIRAYEKDKIVMNDSFRTGDIIRAVVISLGDERNYYISTAGNEYGVVVAKSAEGNAMVPISWKEMRDVVTGKGESRKVAKPA